MSRSRGTAVGTALLCAALATAGCGLGPGEDAGQVKLTVTREFGAVPMLQRSLGVDESDTVMRVLEGSAEISTRYGGGFVKGIEGVEEAQRDGHPYDWFFYVDGVESPVGAADYAVDGRERIWWDYRNWSASNHVPAVVGSWPAPFVAGYDGSRRPVAIECMALEETCVRVREALRRARALVLNEAVEGAIRVVVGPWERLRSDSAVVQLEAGPEVSGVFGGFDLQEDGYALIGLDQAGEAAADFGPDAGLVAATRLLDAPPVWMVTGGTEAGVREAADLLSAAKLRNRYAAVGDEGTVTSLPVEEGR